MLNIPIDIESKYGYIELGQMKKAIKSSVKIDITQGLINIANELSHDSGKKYSIDDIKTFHKDAEVLVNQLQNYICEKKM